MGDEDTRTVVDLLVEEVEFCDVIVLNQVDLVSDADRRRLMSILKGLNPRATIEIAEYGKLGLDTCWIRVCSISMKRPRCPAGSRNCVVSIRPARWDGVMVGSHAESLVAGRC
jgi:hypothetical protein